ncbi:TIGR00730 family Rossman fold protein [Ruixingdingia sedimenti]|uniref:Cytokinin riboside 5'-monophosphate phosphoribohydrolase n=1 Tax=Ruixingdingia sedimenti TaxID=3073604 RepID=A0ABU1F4T9_9RHOB|nr:TIGR00730 family Rossman fold protein [Xinfangfangia sp. LG-4]MDR5651653.1 TIGR00730 family Rossman fold protein [Xinfangfangia sp. LG-4]
MTSSRSVCVFCGARAGGRPSHAAAAKAVGRTIAAAGWRLVYGAGDVGLMGETAQAAQAAGGATLGVIPVHLMGRERGRDRGPGIVVTENMHERKKVMFMNSDAIVVLPGGAGTLDEYFEALTWRQIGLHEKPLFVLNIDGYWDPLLALIDHVIAEGFADASLATYSAVVPDVETLERRLRAALS